MRETTAHNRTTSFRQHGADCFSLRSATTTLLLLLLAGSPAFAVEVLFVTRSASPTTDSSELARVNLIQSWPGFNVTQISSQDTQANYDAALQSVDVVYLSERINTGNIRFDTENTCTGVVLEEAALVDEFGLADTVRNYNSTDIEITDVSHYITSTFATTGNYPVFSQAQNLQHLFDITSLAPGAQVLATEPLASGNPALVSIDTGGLLNNGSTAPSRRVFLPWMDSPSTAAQFNTMTTNGEIIMQRSLEWAAADDNCTSVYKRAFLNDGTPLADGATLPQGARIKFLLYINNNDTPKTDVSLRDILDPSFFYLTPSIRVDNSLPACATDPCTPAEEAIIFSTVELTMPLSDPIDADVVSFTGGSTVDAGNDNVANGQLDIAATSILGITFTVRVQ